METAMRYEREQGRNPEDVSAENLGFDVRSTDSEGVRRYIEVKARSEPGAVTLTQNEWFKAKQFKIGLFPLCCPQRCDTARAPYYPESSRTDKPGRKAGSTLSDLFGRNPRKRNGVFYRKPQFVVARSLRSPPLAFPPACGGD